MADRRQGTNCHTINCIPKASCGKCEGEQAITDIIMSVALEQAALAHIINAEGEKIQKALSMKLSAKDLIRVNLSVETTLKNIERLEISLYQKLRVFEKDYG